MDRWRTQLLYPPGFRCLGLAGWLALNDTGDKAAVLAELDDAPLNVDEATAAVYAALAGSADLFLNLSCLHFDDNSTLSATPPSDFLRALLALRADNVSSDAASSFVIVVYRSKVK